MLDQDPTDVGLRVGLKAELARRDRTESKWTRGEKWAVAATLVALLGSFSASAVVPEVRRWLRLDKPAESQGAVPPVVGQGTQPLSPIKPLPLIGIELRDRYSGYELRVFNEGQILAQQINVDVVAWQVAGMGAVEFNKNYAVRDLIPGADFTIYSRDDHEPISGYFVATCNSCSRPRAWAFYFPPVGRDRPLESRLSREWGQKYPGDHAWPLIEFHYPEERPKYYQCVDSPRGACAEYKGARHRGVLWFPLSKKKPDGQ
jgi:hypothetical protein